MVDLTDDEKELAIAEAMVKKHARLEQDRKKRLAEEKRKDISLAWTPNELYQYARFRASLFIQHETGIAGAQFEPTEFQKNIITALALYFSEAKEFEKLKPKEFNSTGLPFSLQKGIWLWGNPGVGKTLMMEMFSINKRQSFRVVQCPKIVFGYVKYGDEHVTHYCHVDAEAPGASNFFQDKIGYCYNDLGTENTQAKYFGNTINVMEQIFLNTYENRVPFFHRHVTTNLTFDQVKDLYGVRVTDRIKQCFNVFEIKGDSLRR